MSRRERQRSFAIAALVVVAAIAGVSALGDADDTTRSRPATSPAVAKLSPGTPVDARMGEDSRAVAPDAASRRARSAAKRLVRRFIAVFARYQAGRVDKPTVARLRALATRELAAYLLAQPPSRNSRTRVRPRLTRLDLTGPARGRVKAAALLTYGDRRTSLFEVAIERSGRGWRVAELYPSAGT